LKGHTDQVYSVSFSPDGQSIVSGSDDKTIRVWLVESGELVRTLEGHTDWVTSVSFSPDGQSILSKDYSDKKRVWDVTTGQCFHADTESNQHFQTLIGALMSSTSTTKNTIEMNLSSLTQEHATVGFEKIEKVQVYKNGKVAYSTDYNVVHLLTLHSGKQKGT
jgi:WD40 repeat protein